jgi:hypothetical protein
MKWRILATTVLWGFALVYSRHGNDWEVVGQFEYAKYCEQVMDARVDQETRASIGGALDAQAADNPLRRDAYDRALRHVQARFRCVAVN